MLPRSTLGLPGFNGPDLGSYRLGVVGFDSRAGEYIGRAVRAQNASRSLLEIVAFVSPGSIDWVQAGAVRGRTPNMLLCTALVTAILPSGDAEEQGVQFIVETALGPFPVNDLYLSRSGGALIQRHADDNFSA